MKKYNKQKLFSELAEAGSFAVSTTRDALHAFCQNPSPSVGMVTNMHQWTWELFFTAKNRDARTLITILERVKGKTSLSHPGDEKKYVTFFKEGKIECLSIEKEGIQLIYYQADKLLKATQTNCLGRDIFKEAEELSVLVQGVARYYQESSVDSTKDTDKDVDVMRANEMNTLKYLSKSKSSITINWDNDRDIEVIHPEPGNQYVDGKYYIEDVFYKIKSPCLDIAIDFCTTVVGKKAMLSTDEQARIVRKVESSKTLCKYAGLASRLAADYKHFTESQAQEIGSFMKTARSAADNDIHLSKESLSDTEKAVKRHYAPIFTGITDSLRYATNDVDPVTRAEVCLCAAMGSRVRKAGEHKHLSSFTHSALKEEFLHYVAQLNVEGYECTPYVKLATKLSAEAEEILEADGTVMYLNRIEDCFPVPMPEEQMIPFTLYQIEHEVVANKTITALQDSESVYLVSYNPKWKHLKKTIVINDGEKLKKAAASELKTYFGDSLTERAKQNGALKKLYGEGVEELFGSSEKGFAHGKIYTARKVRYDKKNSGGKIKHYSIFGMLKDVSYEIPNLDAIVDLEKTKADVNKELAELKARLTQAKATKS